VLFTFPSRYLFTIGRRLVFSLTRWSAQIHAKLHLGRATQEVPQVDSGFRYGTITFCGPGFQLVSLPYRLWLWTPITLLKNQQFGLFRFRSPLLTESLSLSTPLVNEMFHFTRFHSGRQRRRGRGHRPLGYPIRGPTGCNVFAVNRGLSQLIAPFIVFRHQGIHHQPLMTFV
jgi:hypothetical protein